MEIIQKVHQTWQNLITQSVVLYIMLTLLLAQVGILYLSGKGDRIGSGFKTHTEQLREQILHSQLRKQLSAPF